uniref:TF-B3 domain-containing protein n=1 Tax=Setaria italica TaxID=4555 RepID=K4AJW8_SETIT
MARTRSGGSRMKKPCKCCRRYLDHLEGKNQPMSYFFRRVDANSRHRMIIPNRFVKRFAGKLSRIINLESPNGGLYDVEVKERYNKTVLQRGWEAFVDANRVQENDFLLFHHIEKSRFEVLILGSDGCEKVFPCAGVRNTPSIQERSLDSVDISSSSCHETTESSEREDTPSRNKSFESGDDLQTPPRDGYVLSCRRYLSEAQKGKVIALIQKIKPEVTVFVSIMRKSNVQTSGAYLVISKEYALAHFPHETTFLTLQRPGKSKKWHPRFYIRNDRRVYMLRGQWLDFVRDNHVQEGDICLLLPAKSGRKFMLTVYLLRATDTCPRGGSGTVGFPRVGPFHDRSSAEMTSVVHIKEESTDGEHVSSESSMKEFSEASLNSNDSGGPSDPPYILPAMSCLSKSQKKIVEAKVRAIQSEVPIYVVIMKRTSVDVTHNKMLYAAAHLPVREQTMVLQCNAKIWNTKMEIRNGHRLFLRVGWPEFVRDNSLRVGDICLFELKKNERELTMEVQIISREQF